MMSEALSTFQPRLRLPKRKRLLSDTWLRRLGREALVVLAGTVLFIGLAATVGIRGRPPSAEAMVTRVQPSGQPLRLQGSQPDPNPVRTAHHSR